MKINRHGLLLILSGPAGAGKTTFARMLCDAEENCILSVSATTRPARGNETDGEDYFFLSKSEFKKSISAGAFAEYAEFSGNLYGTPREFLEKTLEEGRHVVFDIEVKGAAQLGEAYPEAVKIFLLPPKPEILVNRLLERKTDSREEVARRMEIARAEILHLKEYDYFIVNDNLETTFSAIQSILRAELHRVRGGEYEAWFDGRDPEEILKVDSDD